MLLDRLPGKTRKERDATGQVLRQREAYPHAVVTGMLPEPRGVRDQLGIDFFRQPFPRCHAVVWLFEAPEDRDRFLGLYPGEPWEVR